MPRLLRTAILVFAIGICVVRQAQTAPDIARGTSTAEVIRAYGWPNGKSTAESREVWLYDEFQVAFEKERVVNVWSIPPDKRQFKRRTQLPADVRRPSNLGAPTTTPSTGTSRQPGSSAVTPVPSTPNAQLEPVPSNRQNESRMPVRSRGVAFDLWPLLAVGCLATILAVAVSERRRIQRRWRKSRGYPHRMHHPSEKAGRTVWPRVWRVRRRPTTTHAQVNHVAPVPDATFGPAPAAAPVVSSTELTYELLDQLEWKRVELIVSLYFAETGIRAEGTCIGADGGVDVQLYRPGEHAPFCYVQCKALGAKVDVKLVRELFGVMSAAKYTEGVFVTTGRYTQDALNFAARNNIQAVSGVGFVDRFNQLPCEARSRIISKVTEGDYTTPTCSQCDIKMVLSSREPPQWRCRRCSNRQYVRKSRWSALRAAKR